jgi:hypothetical protein
MNVNEAGVELPAEADGLGDVDPEFDPQPVRVATTANNPQITAICLRTLISASVGSPTSSSWR